MRFGMSGPAHFVGVRCDTLATKKKGKKKGEEDIPSEPIHGLDTAGSSTAAVSFWVEEGGHAQKPWEGHGWVMQAMRVQAVVIVETLRQRVCFGFWPGKGGGVRGWREGAC